MEEKEQVESTNEEVETKEETNNEVESQQESNDNYSKSDIDAKFILLEDRIRAYINEVLASKNDENTQNEEQETNNERNWE